MGLKGAPKVLIARKKVSSFTKTYFSITPTVLPTAFFELSLFYPCAKGCSLLNLAKL